MLFENQNITLLDFCLWVWMKRKFTKQTYDRQDELFACIMDAAACIQKRENQLRRTICNLLRQAAKSAEDDGGNS